MEIAELYHSMFSSTFICGGAAPGEVFKGLCRATCSYCVVGDADACDGSRPVELLTLSTLLFLFDRIRAAAVFEIAFSNFNRKFSSWVRMTVGRSRSHI